MIESYRYVGIKGRWKRLLILLSVEKEFFGILQGKEFPEVPLGWWSFVEKFTDDVKLRGSPPPIPPWKKSNLVFGKANIKAAAQNFCSSLRHSPVQHLASLACVPSCILLCGGPTWPWAMQLLEPPDGQMQITEQTRIIGNEKARERELVVWGFYPSNSSWAFIGSTLPASDLFPLLDWQTSAFPVSPQLTEHVSISPFVWSLLPVIHTE